MTLQQIVTITPLALALVWNVVCWIRFAGATFAARSAVRSNWISGDRDLPMFSFGWAWFLPSQDAGQIARRTHEGEVAIARWRRDARRYWISVGLFLSTMATSMIIATIIDESGWGFSPAPS